MDNLAVHPEKLEIVDNQSSQSNKESEVKDSKNKDSEAVQAESVTVEKSKEVIEAQAELGSGDSKNQEDDSKPEKEKVPNKTDTDVVDGKSTELTDKHVIKEPVPDKVVEKEADKPVSSEVSESREKGKKSIKLDTKKRKSDEMKTEQKAPQPPLSPVFDENDFSYEEDTLPGKRLKVDIFLENRICLNIVLTLCYLYMNHLCCGSCAFFFYFWYGFIWCVLFSIHSLLFVCHVHVS